MGPDFFFRVGLLHERGCTSSAAPRGEGGGALFCDLTSLTEKGPLASGDILDFMCGYRTESHMLSARMSFYFTVRA